LINESSDVEELGELAYQETPAEADAGKRRAGQHMQTNSGFEATAAKGLSAAEIEEAKANEENLEGSFKELCASKVYIRNLAIMMFIWSFGSFAFFLVPFYVATIKIGNIYANMLFSEIAEFAASILILYVTRLVTL
jgi:uncharacterized protein YqhQ